MLPGLTFSPNALTFSLRSIRVRSISRRIASGSLLMNCPSVQGLRWSGGRSGPWECSLVAFESVWDLLDGVRGSRQPTDRLQRAASDDDQDRGDDTPEHGYDHRGPSQAGGTTDGPPQGDGHEQQHEVSGDDGTAEHSGALSGPTRGLLQFGLGQLQLLPHQGGQVGGDFGDQLSQGLIP